MRKKITLINFTGAIKKLKKWPFSRFDYIKYKLNFHVHAVNINFFYELTILDSSYLQ